MEVRKKASEKNRAATSTPKQATKKVPIKPKAEGTCFVMMPFKGPFNLYYNSIFKPAIKKANLDPVRADDLFRPSVIVSDLWQMIQDAKVLVSELTTKNANVFYELGLAHAIGKPVILVSETMDDVPFDLQQLRVLLYDKDDPAWGQKLCESMTKAITETLEHPVEAVPSIFRTKVQSQAPEQDTITGRIEEIESQLRMIRAQMSARNLRDTEDSLWSEELKMVHNKMDLDNWARRWHIKGVSRAILERAISETGYVPLEEADRLKELLSE